MSGNEHLGFLSCTKNKKKHPKKHKIVDGIRAGSSQKKSASVSSGRSTNSPRRSPLEGYLATSLAPPSRVLTLSLPLQTGRLEHPPPCFHPRDLARQRRRLRHLRLSEQRRSGRRRVSNAGVVPVRKKDDKEDKALDFKLVGD